MDWGERESLNSENTDSPEAVANGVERSLKSLLRLSDRLNSIFDPNSLLDALVGQMLELTNAESGCAGLRTANRMACDHFLQASPGVLTVVNLYQDYASGTGWPHWALANGNPYLTNDALNDSVILPEVRERLSVTSGMCIPIVDGRKEVIAFFGGPQQRFGRRVY